MSLRDSTDCRIIGNLLVPCWRVGGEHDTVFDAETVELGLNLVWMTFDLIYYRDNGCSFEKLL